MWTSSLISRPASILIESNNKLRLPIGINLSASPLLKLLVPLALLVLLPAARALAADINVDSSCTLAQAFNAAVEIPKGNTASVGSCETADTGSNASNRIILPANGSTTLTGYLDFSGSAVPDITIEGNNHTLSGDDKYQVIRVRNSVELTINNLIITNGHSGGDSANPINGGAISIQSNGVLNLNNSVIKNSYATGRGGGIYDGGDSGTVDSLTIKNSLISGNRTGSSGGGIYGGGIIVIENSAIVDNVGRNGGGIAYANFQSASLTIRNSTISGNRATGDGSQQTLNPSFDRGGGGLDAPSGAATLIHVTMTDNTTAVGAALDDQTDSGFTATVKLRNSIIAGNTGGDCNDGLNEIVNSIIEDGSCNVSAVDPKLGGRTGERPWYPLQAGSPAINAGHTDHCLTTDQRGRTRPQGSVCDMGAIEWYPPITVDSGCSLVQAIISANTDATASGSSCEAGFGADTVVLTGDVTLTALYSSTAYGLPSITTAITIEGKGYTVARSSAQNTLRFALFRVLSGGALILNDLTVNRGWNNAGGGGIFVANSHLTLNRSVISNNDSGSSSGGGIYVTDGTVSIRDSAIINNKGACTSRAPAPA